MTGRWSIGMNEIRPDREGRLFRRMQRSQYRKSALLGMTPVARWFIRSARGLKPHGGRMPMALRHASRYAGARCMNAGVAQRRCDSPASGALKITVAQAVRGRWRHTAGPARHWYILCLRVRLFAAPLSGSLWHRWNAGSGDATSWLGCVGDGPESASDRSDFAWQSNIITTSSGS